MIGVIIVVYINNINYILSSFYSLTHSAKIHQPHPENLAVYNMLQVMVPFWVQYGSIMDPWQAGFKIGT